MTDKERYQLIIDGKNKYVEKNAFDNNLDAFVAKYPDIQIKVKNHDGQTGAVPLRNFKAAISEGGFQPVFDKQETPSQEEPKPNVQEGRNFILQNQPSGDLPSVIRSQTQDLSTSLGLEKDYRNKSGIFTPVPRLEGQSEEEYNKKQAQAENRVQVAQLREQLDKQINERFHQIHTQVPEKQGFLSQLMQSVGENRGGTTARNYSIEANAPILDDKSKNLNAADRLLKESEAILHQVDKNKKGGTFIGGALRGLKDGIFNIDTWTNGVSDMVNSTALATAIKKYEQGKPLTEDEDALLTASAVNMATNALFSENLGHGYTSARGVSGSIPFMLEFIANPASGIGKGIGRKVAEYGLKKLGKGLATKTISRGARVLGDIAGSSIMTATTGSAGTLADAAQRFGQGENILTALGKAFGARSIENFSEMAGPYFGPVGNMLSKSKVSKVFNKSVAGKLINRINNSPVSKFVKNKMQFQNWASEGLEEQLGGTINALTIGDQSLKEVWSSDNIIDNFLGAGMMGGFFTGVKAIGYRSPSSRIKNYYKKAEKEAQTNFGDKWGEYQSLVDSGDENNQLQALKNIIQSPDITDEQRLSLFKYKFFQSQIDGFKKSQNQNENPLASKFKRIYEEGYSSVDTPESKKQALQDVKTASKGFTPEQLNEIENIDNPTDYIAAHPEQAEQLQAYFTAKAKLDGLKDAVKDNIEDRILAEKESFKQQTHEDGNIYQTTLFDKPVYITKGNLVLNPDHTVDQEKSDKIILVHDGNKIEAKSIKDISSIERVITASEMEASWEQRRNVLTQLAIEEFKPDNKEVSNSATEVIEPSKDQFTPQKFTLEDGRTAIATAANEKEVAYDILDQNGEIIDSDIMPREEFSQLKPLDEKSQTVNVPEETSSPEEPIQAETQNDPVPTIPLTKDGRTDYKTLLDTDVNLFAQEWEKKRGPEKTKQYLQREMEALDADIKKLSSRLEKERDPNKIDEIEEKIDLYTSRRDNMDAVIREKYGYQSQSQQITNDETGLSEYDKKINALITDTRIFNEQTISKKRSANVTGIMKKANDLGLTFTQDNKGNITLINPKDGSNITRLKAEKRSQNEIQTHKTLNEYSPEFQSLVDKVSQNPLVVLNSNEWTQGRDKFSQGLIDIRNGKQSAAANDVLDKLESIYINNELSYGDGNIVEKTYHPVEEALKFYQNIEDTINEDNSAIIQIPETEIITQSKPKNDTPIVQQDNIENTGDMPEWIFEGYNNEKEWEEAKNKKDKSTKNLIEEPFSEDTDINGLPFVKKANGSTEIGHIKKETGLTEAPIKLSKGYQDENGNGYGLKHIEAQHGKQIRNAGYNSISDFVENVASKFTTIKTGKNRTGNSTYLLELPDTKNNTLFVELSKDGNYWNVNSAGIFRKGYSKGKKIVWTLPAVSHNSTTENMEVARSITGDIGSTSSTSGNSSQTISIQDKNTKNITNNQFSEEKLKQAESEVNLSPTPAQKEAGNYKMGHVSLFGFDISIENPKGSVRSGVDENGNPWSIKMQNNYGYIKGTKGKDGDHIDCFIGKNLTSDKIFVVDQVKPDGTFDEHKVMLGFDTMDDAYKSYMSNYNEDWEGFGDITEIPVDDFKKWVKSSKRKLKPFAEYYNVKENIRYRTQENINDQFNKELSTLTEKNADQKILRCGMPSPILLNAGMPNRDIALYGNKLIKKAKEHGYSISDVRDLPKAIQNPIAVFRGSYPGGYALLTEMPIGGHNALVSIDINKAEVQDLNIITSVFGKHNKGVINWINTGKMLNVDKEKALNYISSSAPIADATYNQELVSATNIINSFKENNKKDIRRASAEINDQFNKELEAFSKGEHTGDFHLGMPGEVLLASGLSNMEIYITPKTLKKHLSKHGLKVEDIKDLPSAMRNPLLVYEWGDKAKSLVVITNIEHGNERITAAIKLERKGTRLEVNELASVHPKEGRRFIDDMINAKHGGLQDALRYIPDKKKALDWLGLAPPKGAASLTSQELSIANIIQNFENPKSGDNIRFRNMEDINRRFNDELQQQISGTLPKGHVYQLGRPGETLRSAGIPNLPVELAASRLSLKASGTYENNHPFDLSAIINLPDAIQSPMAVFDSKTQAGSKVIMTELTDSKGNNFVVAMRTNVPVGQYGKRTIQINSIRSVYPKDNVRDIINWINRGDLLKWADKTKLRNWLTQQRSNSADVAIPISEFDVATNIIENFENPTLSEGEILSEIDNISQSLHTPVNVIRNIEQIQEKNKRDQNRKRKAKGFYDIEKGEVTVLLPNATDISDIQRTLLHEIVGHKGLRELLGKHFEPTMEKVFGSLSGQEQVDLIRKHGTNKVTCAEEYLASLAEKSIKPSTIQKIISAIKEAFRQLGIDLKFSNADMLYMLWRSQNRLSKDMTITDRLRDLARTREAKIVFREITKETSSGEEVTQIYVDPIKEAKEYILNSKLSKDEMKHALIGFIKNTISSNDADQMGKRELSSLLTQVDKANTKYSLGNSLIDVEKTIYQTRTRNAHKKLNRILSLKIQGRNNKNMSIAKNVDDNTRKIFQMVRGTLSDIKKSGLDEDLSILKKEIKELSNNLSEAKEKKDLEKITSLEQQITIQEEKIAELKKEREELTKAKENAYAVKIDEEIKELNDKFNESLEGKTTWNDEDAIRLTALNVLKHFQEITSRETDIKSLHDKLSRLRKDNSEKTKAQIQEISTDGKAYILENRRQMNALRSLINNAQKSYYEDINDLNEILTDLVEKGHANLITFQQEQLERKKSILRQSIYDIKGKKKVNLFEKDSKGHAVDKTKSSSLLNFLISPIRSFEYLCKTAGQKYLPGDGFLYQYFIKGKEGVLEAQNTYITGLKDFNQTFESKIEEIFGKDYKKIIESSDKLIKSSGVHFIESNESVQDFGQKHEMPLTKGQAMYIYMVWKMDDGKCKLLLQGINDETISEIINFLGPEYVKFADWIQDELLPATHKKYNKTYKKIYGTSLNKIENYVPLKIKKEATQQDVELENDYKRQSLQERAGSLINRVHNTRPVDITQNAFNVIYNHAEQMESWNAFAQVRKDLDGILSSTYFRNLMNTNKKGSYDNFKEAAALATHCYHSENLLFDKAMSAMSKGVVGGYIAFRLYTASKQVLSLPAFLGYSQNPQYILYLLKNTGNITKLKKNYDWCKENIPSFYDRVKSGNVGNEKLDDVFGGKIDEYIKTGMLPNRIVDALTCSIGAKSIYEYRYEQYLKQNKSKEEAHRLAIMEADIYYNQSQQSSQPAFLSPTQKSHSFLARMVTTFQNNDLGYNRTIFTSAKTLLKSREWKYLNDLYTQKFMVEEGLNQKDASSKAKNYLINQNKKAFFSIALFGYGLRMLWNYGLLGMFKGPDDDDKEPEDVLKEVAYYSIMPMKGLPLGNILDNAYKGFDYNPFFFTEELSDAFKDITKVAKENGWISPTVAYTALQKASKLTGVDLEVWSNMYLGLEGMIENGQLDIDLLDFALLFNVPKSERVNIAKKLYKDNYYDFITNMSRARKTFDNYRSVLPGSTKLTSRRKSAINKEWLENNTHYEKN